MNPKIVFYITSHGFGHATREIEVISNLPELVEVEIVTTAPRWLFERSLKRAFQYTELLHDIGIVQHDSFEQDAAATYHRWMDLLDRYPAMAEKEAERLAGDDIFLLVGDVSPFVSAVGDALDVPSIVVANFSWDWIFKTFLDQTPEFQEVIDRISDYYKKTTMLLKTPLSGDLSVFSDSKNISLIVRRSTKSRLELREQFGLNPDQRTALISFGGVGFDRINKQSIARQEGITFLTFNEQLNGLPNVRVLDSQSTYHPDAVKVSDFVLAKLGYGLVSECVAHRVPIIYPPRANFPEHDLFERELPHYLPVYKITHDQLSGENWDFFEHANATFNATDYNSLKLMPVNGGEYAADIMLDWVR